MVQAAELWVRMRKLLSALWVQGRGDWESSMLTSADSPPAQELPPQPFASLPLFAPCLWPPNLDLT